MYYRLSPSRKKISEISRKIEIFHVIKGIYLVILYFKDWFIGGVDRILTYLCFNFQASSSSKNIAFSDFSNSKFQAILQRASKSIFKKVGNS